MNFFERQHAVRRLSRRLVALFALAVIGIVVAVDVVVLAAMGFAGRPGEPAAGALLFATLATLAVIGLASLVRIAGLRGGGGAVAQSLGGVRVAEDTTELSLRRLRNVVEEIAIASATPVPEIYVLEHEAGINAFAAGWSPSDAAVAVTRGALDRLNRDELQGVIAHEFSHILNGDMRLNIRLMGLLFGILVLGILGRKVLEHGRFARSGRDSKGAGGVMLVALAVMLIGYIGVFFGRLIKAGVSRQREYLADASAVQFTRQTQGIAGALKKIGGLHEGSKLTPVATEEVSHMLFGDGVGLRSFFATHPPLVKRIQALEPSFKPEMLEQLAQRWRAAPPSGLDEDAALGLVPLHERSPPGSEQTRVIPAAVVAQVGQPADVDFQRAMDLVAAVPDSWRRLAQQPESVITLVFGLLFADDEKTRKRQRFELAARHGDAVAGLASGHADQLGALPPELRLPLAELAFPALRRRPRAELEAFADSVYALVHADGEVSLFEYCLGHLLRTQVHEALDPARHWRPGRRKLVQAQDPAALLLSVLAQVGHAGGDEARRAFHAGIERVLPHRHVVFAPPTDLRELDAAWPVLDELQPLAKSLLIEAMVVAISHDGRVAIAEAELLRTVCAVLHCPLPPQLARRV